MDHPSNAALCQEHIFIQILLTNINIWVLEKALQFYFSSVNLGAMPTNSAGVHIFLFINMYLLIINNSLMIKI